MMEAASKPFIYIYTDSNWDDQRCLKQLLYGIEEEGIFFQLKELKSDDVIYEAYQAAVSSPLLVGIALKMDHLVVHYRSLPLMSPLFNEGEIAGKDNEYLRKMGSNAARLVKGIPFK